MGYLIFKTFISQAYVQNSSYGLNYAAEALRHQVIRFVTFFLETISSCSTVIFFFYTNTGHVVYSSNSIDKDSWIQMELLSCM